jgi:hypothetical protein
VLLQYARLLVSIELQVNNSNGKGKLMERRLLCKKCWNVFDLTITGNFPGIEIHCPACHDTDIMEAPPWRRWVPAVISSPAMNGPMNASNASSSSECRYRKTPLKIKAGNAPPATAGTCT